MTKTTANEIDRQPTDLSIEGKGATLPPCEVAWFAALCDDDAEQLGVIDPNLLSSIEHCSTIVAAAENGGFDSILLPAGYILGIDAITFAAAISQRTARIRLLVAVRMGEMWIPQLARQLATIQHLCGGRLAINIISSDLPGQSLDSEPRYQRTLDSMSALRTLLDGHTLAASHGTVAIDADLAPPRIAVAASPCPPLYFGGLSDHAREVAAQQADVYLMWPDTIDRVAALVADLRGRAKQYGRTLRFGYRVHVIVRDTEPMARQAANHLVAALDDRVGEARRSQSLDSQSVGVNRQAQLRADASDDGYVEANLWTGIGRGRSGCGAAIVGSAAQVVDKINAYRRLGIDCFIFSGYPHLQECERFARCVLPDLRA